MTCLSHTPWCQGCCFVSDEQGMGGAGSDEMKRFRSHCYSAFLILRKHATLILNLFALMVDSNVQDIALDPDRTTAKVTPTHPLQSP